MSASRSAIHKQSAIKNFTRLNIKKRTKGGPLDSKNGPGEEIRDEGEVRYVVQIMTVHKSKYKLGIHFPYLE